MEFGLTNNLTAVFQGCFDVLQDVLKQFLSNCYWG